MNKSGYISSVKRVTLSLVIVAITTVTLAYQEYKTALQFSYAFNLSFLSAVSKIQADEGTEKPLTVGMLSHVYIAYGINETIQRLASKDALVGEDKLIDDAAFIPSVNFSLSPMLPCTAVRYRGKPNQNMSIENFISKIYVGNANMSDLYLFNFSTDCRTYAYGGPGTLLFIDLRKEVGDWLVGIPSAVNLPFLERYRIFPDTPTEKISPSLAKILQAQKLKVKPEDFTASSIDKVGKLIEVAREYRLIPLKYIQNQIVEQTARTTGRLHGNDIDAALSDLSTFVTDRQSSIEGIPLNGEIVIDVAPIVATILAFVLWQRVRMLKYADENFEERGGEPWLIFDARGLFEVVVSLVSTTIPIIAVTTIFWCFAFYNGESFGTQTSNVSFVSWVHMPSAFFFSPSLSIYDQNSIYATVLLALFFGSLFFVISATVNQIRMLLSLRNTTF